MVYPDMFTIVFLRRVALVSRFSTPGANMALRTYE